MPMRALAVLLALLVAPASVWGVDLFLSGGDVVDTASGTGTDSLDFDEEGTANEDEDIRVQTALRHKTSNGGHDSSQFTFRVDAASGEAAYYRLLTNASCTAASTPFACCTGSKTGSCPTTISGTRLCVGWNLHVGASPPSGDRRHVEIRYDSDLDGAPDASGCIATLQNDRDIVVSVVDTSAPNTFGTAAVVTGERHCSDNALTSCTQNSECASGSCLTCDTANGTGCYFAGLELCETHFGATMACDLWVNGRRVVSGGSGKPVVPQGPIQDVWIGATGTESETLPAYFDDVVLNNSDRARLGFVARTVPSDDGDVVAWGVAGCSTGAEYACIDDYNVSSFLLGTDETTTNKKNKAETFDGTSPDVSVGSLTVSSVESVLVGQPGTSSTVRYLTHELLVCPTPTTCANTSPVTFLVEPLTATSRVLSRVLATTSPVVGAPTWNNANLPALGVRYATTNQYPGGGVFIDIEAALHYIRAVRPDAPQRVTLRDQNKGPDDGKVMIASFGDSTNAGTQSLQCQGGVGAGTLCAFQDYCPNVNDETRDHPTGGCLGVDAVCQTCQLRRLEFNGGAGYPCGPNNDSATCNLGTCAGESTGGCGDGLDGTCSGDDSVLCSCDSDCNLGNCDTCSNANCASQTPASTCVDSCPGGECPTARAGWGDYIASGADGVVRCGVGGISSLTLASASYWPKLIELAQVDCVLVAGTATGVCRCGTNADCDGTTGGGTCAAGTCSGGACTYDATVSCTVNADCNRCTAGDPQRVECTAANSCQTPYLCDLPNADYISLLIGYNDLTGGHAPRCQTWEAAAVAVCADDCVDMPCAGDADCSVVSSASKCYGEFFTGTDNVGCYSKLGILTPSCTMSNAPCKVSGDCPIAGQSCLGGNLGDAHLPGTFGICTCTIGAGECPLGHICKNGAASSGEGFCWKTCTVNGDCGTNGICAAGGYCQGICSCPEDACPGAKCQTGGTTCDNDIDCLPNVVLGQGQSAGYTWTFSPSCDLGTGKCKCTGPNRCRTYPDCQKQYAEQARVQGHWFTLQWIQSMQDQVAALSESDGRPLILVNTLPGLGLESYNQQPARECTLLRTDGEQLLAKIAGHLLADPGRFPHVVDARRAGHRLPRTVAFTDDVHFTPRLSEVVGGANTTYLDSLNTCGVGARETAAPQRYCRHTDDRWKTCAGGSNAGKSCAVDGDCPSSTCSVAAAPCTTSADCTGTQTCQLRSCVCACGHTNECVNWFGSGHSCVSGTCQKSGTDSCAAVGSGTCSSGVCSSGCPDSASGDACRVE